MPATPPPTVVAMPGDMMATPGNTTRPRRARAFSRIDMKKLLWRCPECGHEYVTRNMWHSCARYAIADHFAGKGPELHALYERFRNAIKSFGPVKVYAQKTRIVFQVRTRFAGVTPRQRWLDCTFWLKRRAPHPLIRRVELIPPRDYIHHFRLQIPEDLDAELQILLRESYGVGCQESAEDVELPPKAESK